MTGACRLNNMNMRSYRREGVYQTLAIDLAMLGVISKEECEMLIGAGIPKGLRLPDGTPGKFISEENIPEQPVVVDDDSGSETETTDDEETGLEEVTEPGSETEVINVNEGTTKSDN